MTLRYPDHQPIQTFPELGRFFYVVSDAHVASEHHNVAPFFDMLDALAGTDLDLLFLGDLFDLWIGIKRYEFHCHQRFIQWCLDQGQNRHIGFIEGNHEFFVAEAHHELFAARSDRALSSDKWLFVHGDLINRADTQYLGFRKRSKTALVRSLVRWLPLGPYLVKRLKSGLKNTNKAFRFVLPKHALSQFAAKQSANGFKRILVGHFHQRHDIQVDKTQLTVMPDWFTTQHIAKCDRDSGSVTIAHWRDLT